MAHWSCWVPDRLKHKKRSAGHRFRNLTAWCCCSAYPPWHKGLNNVKVSGECIIDFQTLRDSKNIPKNFLFKIGLSEIYIDYLPDFYNEKPLRLFPVFLSHSSADKTFTVRLYEALTAKRVRVWYDEHKLKPGDEILDSIDGQHKRRPGRMDRLIVLCIVRCMLGYSKIIPIYLQELFLIPLSFPAWYHLLKIYHNPPQLQFLSEFRPSLLRIYISLSSHMLLSHDFY